MFRRFAATLVGAPIVMVHTTAGVLADLLRGVVLAAVLIMAILTPVITAKFDTSFGVLRTAVVVLVGWAVAEGVRGASSYALDWLTRNAATA